MTGEGVFLNALDSFLLRHGPKVTPNPPKPIPDSFDSSSSSLFAVGSNPFLTSARSRRFDWNPHSGALEFIHDARCSGDQHRAPGRQRGAPRQVRVVQRSLVAQEAFMRQFRYQRPS